VPFERFARDRERGRGTMVDPAALKVAADRKRIILTARALQLLPEGVKRVHLAADGGDQALALIPADDDDAKAYIIVRRGRQGIVTAVAFIRHNAIAAGRYRAETQRVLGKASVAAHYVRSDRA
jgi:hypothetical protein